jgi:hypothetical protein
MQKIHRVISFSSAFQQRLAGLPTAWHRGLPILDWGSRYSRETLSNDLLAAVIVTIMLIPQSLAYALLAGLPAEVGLYASILPLVAYALFGTSRTLAVGPVAVISLMTASAIGSIAPATQVHPATAAVLLAFMSGIMLIAMGIFRLGAIANFLSHPSFRRPDSLSPPASSSTSLASRRMEKISSNYLPRSGRASARPTGSHFSSAPVQPSSCSGAAAASSRCLLRAD